MNDVLFTGMYASSKGSWRTKGVIAKKWKQNSTSISLIMLIWFRSFSNSLDLYVNSFHYQLAGI